MNDQLTAFFRKAVNILLVTNPQGTSIGILLGVVLDGVFGVFSPILKTYKFFSLAALKVWHLTGFGVLIMNIPSYLRRNRPDASVLEAISYIEEQRRRGTITEWQAKQMYAELHNKVLDRVMGADNESVAAKQIGEILADSNQSGRG